MFRFGRNRALNLFESLSGLVKKLQMATNKRFFGNDSITDNLLFFNKKINLTLTLKNFLGGMKQKHTIQKNCSIRDFEEFNYLKKKSYRGRGVNFYG